jgi:hypothetical protein
MLTRLELKRRAFFSGEVGLDWLCVRVVWMVAANVLI